MSYVLLFFSLILMTLAIYLLVNYSYCGSSIISLPTIIYYFKAIKKRKIVNQKLQNYTNNSQNCKIFVKNNQIKFGFFSIKLRLSRAKMILHKKIKRQSSPQKAIESNSKILNDAIKFVGNKLSLVNKKFRGLNHRALIECFAQTVAFKIAYSAPINAVRLVDDLLDRKIIYSYERDIYFYLLVQYLLVYLSKIKIETLMINKKVIAGKSKKEISPDDYLAIYSASHFSKNASAQLLGLSTKQIKFGIRQTLLYYDFLTKQANIIIGWIKFLLDRHLVY